MAHAWNACWVNALGGSNPPFSATGNPVPIHSEPGFLLSSRLSSPRLLSPSRVRPRPASGAGAAPPFHSDPSGPKQGVRRRVSPLLPAPREAEMDQGAHYAAPASPGTLAPGSARRPQKGCGSRATVMDAAADCG